MSWWFPRPLVQYECQNCHRQVQIRVDDLITGKGRPPKECPACGNNGNNWVHCRGDNHWIKAEAIPEDWEEDMCPACVGREVDESLITKNHPFVFPQFSSLTGSERMSLKKIESRLRCAKCGELSRHSIHELDDDDDWEEDDEAPVDIMDSELADGWRHEIEEEDDEA